VSYRINGADYKNIYGLTIESKKEGGTQTTVYIQRCLEQGGDMPAVIESLEVTARLFKEDYEPGQGSRRLGMWNLVLSRLALVSDETQIDAGDSVIGQLRYYCAGGMRAEVYSSNEGAPV
jgi:hypothetical protein